MTDITGPEPLRPHAPQVALPTAHLDPGGAPPATAPDPTSAPGEALTAQEFADVDAKAATGPEGPDHRNRVEWVRPTDLVARMSARASERGIEWNIRAHEWARTQVRAAVSETRVHGTRMLRYVRAPLTRPAHEPLHQEAPGL